MESGRAVLNVLVAEPHQTVAQALSNLVDEVGSARIAGTSSTPADTFESCRRLAPDVALVDLDLTPDCALINSLRTHCPTLRVLVLADRTPEGRAQVIKAMSAGALGAIYKESSLEDFDRALTCGGPTIPDDTAELLLESYIGALAEKRNRELAMVEALAGAVEIRDFATGQHLHRVTELAQRCLESADRGLAMNADVRYGFMLHDVGKIGIPDSILNKPGPLDRVEWSIMRRHPEMGVGIVEPVGLTEMATNIILCHHERWDGEGYPYGLAKDEIPVAARAFAVADAYDAMTSDRPYRSAMSRGDALQIIRGESGRTFDPDMVEVLISVAMIESHDHVAVIDLTA